MVQNGWIGVEQSWNELQDLQVEVLNRVGSAGVPPGKPKRDKMAKNGQNLTLSTLVFQNGWNELYGQRGYVYSLQFHS